jgi:hypothetical protein
MRMLVHKYRTCALLSNRNGDMVLFIDTDTTTQLAYYDPETEYQTRRLAAELLIPRSADTLAGVRSDAITRSCVR